MSVKSIVSFMHFNSDAVRVSSNSIASVSVELDQHDLFFGQSWVLKSPNTILSGPSCMYCGACFVKLNVPTFSVYKYVYIYLRFYIFLVDCSLH
jgi:hypothetical protein